MEKKNEPQAQGQTGQVDRQKAPVAPNQPRENLVRYNYHEDNEGLINRQINLELYASYAYMALSHHFDRSDVALKGKATVRSRRMDEQNIVHLGHHEFFKKMSEEEREHANKFMTYQNKRGGTIVLLDVKVRSIVVFSSLIECLPLSSPETDSTKLGLTFGSSSNGFTTGKRCLSSIAGVACLCLPTQVRASD